MRYLMIVKGDENFAASGPPPMELMEAIGKLGEEAAKSGKMVSMGGLKHSSDGATVRLKGGKMITTDGPFSEAKEVIGGFTIMNLKSKEEAIAEAVKFMELHRIHWPDFEGEAEGITTDMVLEKIVAEHAKPGPIGPTVPIGKPIPKDVSVIFINAGAPANIAQEESFDEAAQLLGWKVENLTTEPTPPAIQSTFEEVIRREPDAVATTGLAIEQFPQQAKKLNELEIPIISNTGTDPSTFDPKEGITLQNQEPDEVAEAAALLADKALVDAGGEGEFGAVNLTGYPSVAINVEGFEHEIESRCPKCTLKHLEVNPTSLGKDAPTIITNFLRANSGISGIYFGYDGIAVGLNAALKGAGVTPPRTYAWAPDEVGVEELQTGEQTAAIPLGCAGVAMSSSAMEGRSGE